MFELSNYSNVIEIRSLYAVIALFLSIIFGLIYLKIDFINARPLYHKILEYIFGQFFSKLDRKERSNRELKIRGLFFLLFICSISVMIAVTIDRLAQINKIFIFLEIFLLSSLIITSSYLILLYRVFDLFKQNKNLKGRFYSLAITTGYDLNSLDDYGIVRVSISFISFVLWRYIIAPLFWYLIFGLIGAVIYSSILFVTSISSPRGRGGAFLTPAELIEKIFAVIPAFITIILFFISSIFTPKLSPFNIFKLSNNPEYSHGWLPLCILAAILRVTLGGPVKYIDGKIYKNSWVGIDGDSSKVNYSHIKKAIYLLFISIIFVILFLFVFFLL